MGQYLIDLLFDIGPVSPTGMGAAPLSYSDIWHADQMQRLGLSAWEAQMLRHLSREYASTSHKATDRNMAAPFITAAEPNDDQRKRVATGLAAALRGMAKRPR